MEFKQTARIVSEKEKFKKFNIKLNKYYVTPEAAMGKVYTCL